MKESFFRQFFRLKNEISEDIRRSKSDCIERQFSEQAEICVKLIWTYMMSCKWQNTERTKTLMPIIRYKDSEIADKLDISANTVRSLKSCASAKLFEKLGEDCFEVIRSGEERRIKYLIYKLKYLTLGYDDVFEFVPKGIIDAVMLEPRKSNTVYKISECRREIMFLARYDLIGMIRHFDTLDEDKLAYVLEILMLCNPTFGEKEKQSVTMSVLNAEEDLNIWLGL